MKRIIVETSELPTLHNLNRTLELCNESGEVLGYFLTVADYKQLLIEWAKLKFPEDELERRWNESGERTTAEVLAQLAE